jgi:Ca2+-binding EF-hand superfamily protein
MMPLLDNKKLFAAGMLSIVLASTTVSTDVDAQERGKKADRKDRTEKQFNRLDADDDGVLVLDELTGPALAKAEKKFTRKDADEDGFLTFEESTAGRESQDLSDIIEEIAQCVADIKEETGNEDIVVPDPEDYMTPQEKFDAVDTSGDALLDFAEVQANATAKAETAFAKMDTDADAQITLDEFQAHAQSSKATRRAVRSCVEELTTDDII